MDNGYLDKESGRPNRYSLTDDGFTIVKKRRETKAKRLQEVQTDENTVAFEDAFDEFCDYFTVDDVEQRLVEAEMNNEMAVVNYQQFEKFAPDVADAILTDPETMLDAAKAAIKQQVSAVESELSVRFTNLPDYHETKIRHISTQDVGELVTVPGIVLKASVTRPVMTEATFECSACGAHQTKKQPDGKRRNPYKCECGNRKFDIVDRTFQDVRILKLQEKPDSPDKKKIKVRVYGELSNESVVTDMNPGTSVRLTGIVRAEEPNKRNGQYFTLYIEAVDIEEEQNKWDEVELTSADRERNQEIVEYGPVAVFQDSVAMDRVIHRDLMKEAFLLYLLGKTDRGNLHVLVMGEPGTGKSQLNNWAETYLPRTVKASATGASAVGLTATVKEDKDFGGYVAEGGSLTLADGGYHITDEFDKLDGADVENFNDALQDGEIILNKGDITDLKLQADVSEWASANPREYDYFEPSTPKYQQIPIPPQSDATKDRFDVIIGIETYAASSDKKQDVATHILRRGEDGYAGTEPAFSAEALVKFVTEASRLSPTMTNEAHDLIYEAYFTLLEESHETQKLITNRKLEALKRLAIAYARAHLSDEVKAEHAQMACNFFRRSLESIDFEIGKDSFTDVNPKAKADRRELKTLIESLTVDGEAVPLEDVITESDFDEDRVEELVQDLKKHGDLMEPRNGEVTPV